MPEDIKKDILRQYDAGQAAYTAFVKERILGTDNLWDKMPKLKLKKWSSAAKSVQTKVGSKIVELKENRSLFARMAIAAKSRSEVDMEQANGSFELSGVSRSLFAADGSLLPATDKSKLMYILKDLPSA